MQPAPLSLRLDAAGIDQYCRQLLGQTRQSAQALAALTALQTFIEASADGDAKAGAAFGEIKAILERHGSAARHRVMTENLDALLGALHNQDLCGVQQVHSALSRNGFHQTALAAINLLPRETLLAAAAWTSTWRNDAKARAEAASGYPDALDLKGAGIAPERYTAMNELNLYLQEAAG
ncbi:MAG: hypothetical protein KGZ83_09575 [Sulfuricella sp.]|nr:hypothetical protein [Sulfuricella sp.]